eukprot:2731371-Amphidinium_carterae.1
MSVNGIKQVLPRSYRALQGFARVDPPVARDPTPIEAAALSVHHLQVVTSADLTAMLSGLAFVIGFDLFARPSEVLCITADEIVAPRHFGYGDVGAIIASSKPMCGGVPMAAKSVEFDETIIAWLPGMQLEFVRSLLQRMAALFPQGVPLLHPLTLGQFERAVRSASHSLSLERLRIFRTQLDMAAHQWLATASSWTSSAVDGACGCRIGREASGALTFQAWHCMSRRCKASHACKGMLRMVLGVA